MKKLLKTIGINIGLLLLMIAILELSLQVVYSIRDTKEEFNNPRSSLPNYDDTEWIDEYWKEHLERRFEYHSYVGWKGIPYQGNQINVDKSGYRHTVNDVKTEEATHHVAFLGGSTMWGDGSNDENTIPSLFVAENEGVFALNLGQPNYVARQGVLALEQELAKGYRPDLVIAYDGVNDMPLGRIGFTIKREAQIRELMKDADSQKKGSFLWATKHLAKTLHNLAFNHEKPLSKRYQLSPEKSLNCARDVLESWLTLKQVCEANQIDLIVCLQPNAGVGNPNLDNMGHFSEGFKSDGKAASTAAYYDDIKELLNSSRYVVLKPHFLDLTGAFDDLPNVYLDFCHVSPNGNLAIARKLTQHLNAKTK